MSIPKLRQSFCGCTLETSSLIIAWLGVVSINNFLIIHVAYHFYCTQLIKNILYFFHSLDQPSNYFLEFVCSECFITTYVMN